MKNIYFYIFGLKGVFNLYFSRFRFYYDILYIEFAIGFNWNVLVFVDNGFLGKDIKDIWVDFD